MEKIKKNMDEMIEKIRTTEEGKKFLIRFLKINIEKLDIYKVYDYTSDDGIEEAINDIEYISNINFIRLCLFLCSGIGKNYDFDNILKTEPFILPKIENILSNKDPKYIENIPNFKGTLYPSQTTVLYRMMKMESDNFYEKNKFNIMTNTAMISERMSFGKTYMIAAFLCLQPCPKTTFHIKKEDQKNTSVYQSYFDAFMNWIKYCPYMKYKVGTRYHSPNDYTLPINMVICNIKTLEVWVSNISNYTSLTFLKITNHQEIEMFSKLIFQWKSESIKKNRKTIKLPQVILVKDGNVSNIPIIEYVTKILGDLVLSRIIIDDFDMLKYDIHTILPNSVFNWLISSTMEISKYDLDIKDEDRIDPNSFGRMISACFFSKIFFNISCNYDYGNNMSNSNMPIIEFYSSTLSHIFKIKNDNKEKFISGNSIYNDDISICQKKNKDDENTHFYKSIDAYIDFATNTTSFDYFSLYELNFIFDDTLLTGKVDIPYDPIQHGCKVLIYCPLKNEQILIVEALKQKKQKAIILNKDNIKSFKYDDNTFAISSLITGVNMNFLTHIIVFVNSCIQDMRYKSEITQVIGRGQRLRRRCNLQVLLLHKEKIIFI